MVQPGLLVYRLAFVKLPVRSTYRQQEPAKRRRVSQQVLVDRMTLTETGPDWSLLLWSAR